MSSPLPAIWLASITAIATLNVSAQTPAAAPKAPASAASAAGTSTEARPQTPPGSYRSAFEGYQPFTEESVRPWRESNDTVGTVGGWRAYAKEAAGSTDKDAQAPKPAASGPRTGQSKP